MRAPKTTSITTNLGIVYLVAKKITVIGGVIGGIMSIVAFLSATYTIWNNYEKFKYVISIVQPEEVKFYMDYIVPTVCEFRKQQGKPLLLVCAQLNEKNH